jgi:hypothetical protein
VIEAAILPTKNIRYRIIEPITPARKMIDALPLNHVM